MESIWQFVTLLIATELVRRFIGAKPYYPTASGSIIMAIGIFLISAFNQLPFSNASLNKLFTIELFIIWLYLAYSFLASYYIKIKPPLIHTITDLFGIGTWVASCAILVILFLAQLPNWQTTIFFLSSLAIIIWIVYIKFVLLVLPSLITKQLYCHSGILFLSTVSTQAIALMLHALFAQQIPYWLYALQITLGYCLYVTSLFIIVRQVLTVNVKRLILTWSHPNSIIHGALSISGLASISTNAVSMAIIWATWFIASSLFFLVEGISIAKLGYRIKVIGWQKAILAYDISQWSRLFTYGMFYAFNLALVHDLEKTSILQSMIIHRGQYIVCLLLTIEIILSLCAKK